MYQTQSSWCINKAANLANLVEICIAADTANVGGEGELEVNGEAEIVVQPSSWKVEDSLVHPRTGQHQQSDSV